jgi:flagellar basal body-associated protein FliL
MNSATGRSRLISWMMAALIAALTLPGCYNSEALLKQHREASKHLQMEEVDLGQFSVCLPHTLGNATDHIVEFHVFGQVESQHREKVDAALDLRNAELRSRMLIAIRKLEQADFDEPRLTKLRNSIAEVINGAVSEQLVKKVGFYHFSFATLD